MFGIKILNFQNYFRHDRLSCSFQVVPRNYSIIPDPGKCTCRSPLERNRGSETTEGTIYVSHKVVPRIHRSTQSWSISLGPVFSASVLASRLCCGIMKVIDVKVVSKFIFGL